MKTDADHNQVLLKPNAAPSPMPALVRARPDAEIDIFGVPMPPVTADQAVTAIDGAVASRAHVKVAFANAHTLNIARSEPTYREVLRAHDFVFNDGIGVQLAARMRGSRFPQNLNGSDFTFRIVELAQRRGWRVYFFGAQPGIAEAASRRLVERYPGLQIAGHDHGYGHRTTGRVADRIRRSRADLVLVALGNPTAERWVLDELERSGARAAVSVGAFFDFVAGEFARAPRWISRLGLEWLFRLMQEPRRMWRRYVLGNPRFLLAAASEAVGRQRV